MNSTPTGIHPAPTIFTQAQIEADNILQFFHYAHLPEKLQAASQPFCHLAAHIITTLSRRFPRIRDDLPEPAAICAASRGVCLSRRVFQVCRS